MGTQNRNGIGEPVWHHAKPIKSGPGLVPQTSDEFNSPQLGLQWQWHANHKKTWYSLGRRKGWLRLYPQLVTEDKPSILPNLLLQKFPARSFVAETLFDFVPKQSGDEAGLIVAGKSSAALAVEKTDSGNRLVLRINGMQRYVQENVPTRIKLRVRVKNGGLCSFSFDTFNGFMSFPEKFQAECGVWIGAKVGLYSINRKRSGPRGHVDVDYFRFSPLLC
jgi:beta-xylosidase